MYVYPIALVVMSSSYATSHEETQVLVARIYRCEQQAGEIHLRLQYQLDMRQMMRRLFLHWICSRKGIAA